jgi:hypothetical protein
VYLAHTYRAHLAGTPLSLVAYQLLPKANAFDIAMVASDACDARAVLRRLDAQPIRLIQGSWPGGLLAQTTKTHSICFRTLITQTTHAPQNAWNTSTWTSTCKQCWRFQSTPLYLLTITSLEHAQTIRVYTLYVSHLLISTDMHGCYTAINTHSPTCEHVTEKDTNSIPWFTDSKI